MPSIRDDFLTKQPIVSRVFANAIQKGSIAHAYLLIGEAGTPIKQIGEFLAKSILCDHPSPLACEECVTCQRIANGQYPDYRFFDGSEASIKKDEVSEVVADFQETPLESKGIMVYLINEVENMTVEAANSLLKFLEEPTPYAYAILTTKNEAKVLPTIISRCQSLHLKRQDRAEVLEECTALGVDSKDAELLSCFICNAPLIFEQSKEEEFTQAKQAFEDVLEALAENESYCRYVLEKDVTPLLNSKPAARFFFDLLAFQDIVASKESARLTLPTYANIWAELAKSLPHPEESLLSVMTLRGEIETNINVGLLLTHLNSLIFKE